MTRRILGLLGADGAGKSTVTEHLGTVVTGGGAPQALHGRPQQLVAGRGATSTSDPQGRVVLPLWSAVLRVVLWSVESVLLRVSAGPLLLWERPIHDLLVDPRRYGLPARVAPLARLAVRIVTRAGHRRVLVVGLLASPEVAVRRKPELAHEEVAAQNARLQALADSGLVDVLVRTDELAPDAVAATITKAMAARGWDVRHADRGDR